MAKKVIMHGITQVRSFEICTAQLVWSFSLHFHDSNQSLGAVSQLQCGGATNPRDTYSRFARLISTHSEKITRETQKNHDSDILYF